MKKLSILVALILCVTIGGVYAVWNYAENAVEAPDDVTAGVQITESVSETEKGEITLTNTLVLVIDDNEGNHTPGWDDDGSNGGAITITYTPNAGSPATKLAYAITIEGNDFNGNQIFTLDGTTIAEGVIDCSNTEATTFTITYAEFIGMLPVNAGNVLPTLADYENYKAALDGVTITISVAEDVSQ